MKTPLLAILLITFLNVSAQKNGISLEPIIGYGTGFNVGNNGGAPKIGCGIIYMINDHFGVSSGLQYSSITSTLGSFGDTNSFTTTTGSIQFTFTYLEIPLIVRYVSSKDNKIGFFAEAGFNFGFLINSSESGAITQTYNDFFTSSPPTSSVDLVNGSVSGTSAFNVSGHLALGIFIPLSEKCSLILDGEYNIGLTSTGNGNNDVVYFNGVPYNYYTSSFTLSQKSSSYGNNISALACARLNIKLGGSAVKHETNASQENH